MTDKRKSIGWYAVLCTGIVNATLVLALLNSLLFLHYRGANRRSRSSEKIIRRYGTNTLQAVYPNLDLSQIRNLLEETWDRRLFDYEALTQFRERPFEGRYVNVESCGYRRTKNQGPWPPDPSAFNVFLFGGSTTFGYGVPDEETLASHLQDVLTPALGMDVRVYNFGRGFYYSALERLLLEKLLLNGDIPDQAVFVDGLNERFEFEGNPLLAAQIQQSFDMADRVRAIDFLAQWVRRQPLARWIQQWWRTLKEEDEDGSLDEDSFSGEPAYATPPARKPAPGEDPYGIMIERYLRNKRMIESACEAFDIPVLFVWQPIPYYKYNLRHHPFARKNRNSPRARRYTMRYTRMADWVRAQPMGTNFLWCADIQEGVQEALYVDDVHYSPRLNRLLAKAIASGIVERAHSAP